MITMIQIMQIIKSINSLKIAQKSNTIILQVVLPIITANTLCQKFNLRIEHNALADQTPEGIGKAQNVKTIPIFPKLSRFVWGCGIFCGVKEIKSCVDCLVVFSGLILIFGVKFLLLNHLFTTLSQCAKIIRKNLIFSKILRKGKKMITAKKLATILPNIALKKAVVGLNANSPKIALLITRGIAPFASTSGTIARIIPIKNTTILEVIIFLIYWIYLFIITKIYHFYAKIIVKNPTITRYGTK